MKVSQVEEEVALHTVDGILVHSSVEGLGLGNFCLRVGEYYSPPAFKKLIQQTVGFRVAAKAINSLCFTQSAETPLISQIDRMGL
jgi:hypothetical protein